MSQTARDYTVRGVARTCMIMTLLQESSAVPLSTIARMAGLPRSSAFRYLWTLEDHRYVEDVGKGQFRLGLGFVGMQSRHIETLREAAHPWLWKLCHALGETVTLGCLDGEQVICLDRATSPQRLRFDATRGNRTALHTTAIGKAIAAQLPNYQVREALTQTGMRPRTPRTITTVEEYLAEVAKGRSLGYAIDDGEHDADGRCVAVPVPSTRAALSVSAPAARLPMHEIHSVVAHLYDAVADIADVLQRTKVQAPRQRRPRTKPSARVTDKQIVTWYDEEGLPLKEVARRAGISVATVRRRLLAHGVQIRPSATRKRLDVTDKQIVTWYDEEGLPLDEVARRAGISRPTVRDRLVGRGIEIRPRRNPVQVNDEQLAAWYEQGNSLSEVAQRAGASRMTVRNRLITHGVQMRPRGAERRVRLKMSDTQLAARYTQGSTLTELAEQLGTSLSIIRNRVVAGGGAIRSSGGGGRAKRAG